MKIVTVKGHVEVDAYECDAISFDCPICGSFNIIEKNSTITCEHCYEEFEIEGE